MNVYEMLACESIWNANIWDVMIVKACYIRSVDWLYNVDQNIGLKLYNYLYIFSICYMYGSTHRAVICSHWAVSSPTPRFCLLSFQILGIAQDCALFVYSIRPRSRKQGWALPWLLHISTDVNFVLNPRFCFGVQLVCNMSSRVTFRYLRITLLFWN